jgi:hypothetical protein
VATQNDGKLNQLLKELPEGLLVDSVWLRQRGYSTSLCRQYVVAGWLEQPARRVYRRPRGHLTWQQVVISLQVLLEKPLSVGGRTALELQGFGHYLSEQTREVHLYGPDPLPTWLKNLQVGVTFRYHNDKRLFANDPAPRGFGSLEWSAVNPPPRTPDPLNTTFRRTGWGPWDYAMTLSTPERAVLEMLDELPKRESFHQADKVMEGLSSLSPRRLTKLLRDCRSVKVKRLFFFFADRHPHTWRRHLKPEDFDLGTGNRALVAGGKLDTRYHLMVPEDLDGLA